MPQKALDSLMSAEQKHGIRKMRRMYLGRLGDVLRQRQAINAELHAAVPSPDDSGRQMEAKYLKVRTFCTPAACMAKLLAITS